MGYNDTINNFITNLFNPKKQHAQEPDESNLAKTLGDMVRHDIASKSIHDIELSHSLVNLNIRAESGNLRQAASDGEIAILFERVWAEDKVIAMKYLFYLRDIICGLGERRAFRVLLKHLVNHHPLELFPNIEHIPFYGRWDDLFVLLGSDFNTSVLRIISTRLEEDITIVKAAEKSNLLPPRISILAKWMPSVNASSEKTRMLGKYFAKKMCMSEKEYRQNLTKLRKYIDVVECKMSAKEWSKINYENVPIIANIKYENAFGKNDKLRRFTFRKKKFNDNLRKMLRNDVTSSANLTVSESISDIRKQLKSGNISPYDGLMKILMSERYEKIKITQY